MTENAQLPNPLDATSDERGAGAPVSTTDFPRKPYVVFAAASAWAALA